MLIVSDEWQLLPIPIHMSKFQKMPYLREHFHLYEMTILEKSNKVCKLVAENETINISFGLPEDRSGNYMFKFMLSQKRTQIESNKPVDILLTSENALSNKASSGILTYESGLGEAAIRRHLVNA
jgi:hypothetical protein